MEDVCQDYFDELVSASFLQLREKENSHEEDYYLVHDLLHDLAEKAAGSDCFRIENSWRLFGKCPTVEVPSDVRHVFVQIYNKELITKKICKLDNLRTLIIDSEGNWEAVEEKVLKCMFKSLRKLRVLTITTQKSGRASSYSSDLPIPACIGQLRHLRYLAFRTGIVPVLSIRLVVPATLGKLYHMQVLDFGSIKEVVFSSCEDLINLRHVICFENAIPSIGRLTSLRTMRAFNVRKEQEYELKQLGNLHKLHGQLWISGLEKVDSKAEVLKANLAGKEGLTTLKLSWRSGEASPEVQAEVLEGLCPPKDLKSLIIEDYEGPRYPGWMHNGGPKHVNHLALYRCSAKPGPELGGFYAHLRELMIKDCSWDALPDYMEHLTSLQRLEIKLCKNIRSPPALPPSLEHLNMSHCSMVSMSSCSMEHLTSLQKLEIRLCPNIWSLPALPLSLEHLRLVHCIMVSMTLCSMEHLTSLQTLMILYCDSIWSLPTLPQSIKEFRLAARYKGFMNSCKTIGDPDWQKIKHIPYATIDYIGSRRMGVIEDPKDN